jgi:hypothetical protein
MVNATAPDRAVTVLRLTAQFSCYPKRAGALLRRIVDAAFIKLAEMSSAKIIVNVIYGVIRHYFKILENILINILNCDIM